MSTKYFCLAFIISLLFFSCKKNNGPAAPIVTLTSPSDTSVIYAGDTVLLSGTATDDKSLHELYLTLTDSSGTSILFTVNPYVHGLKIYYFGYYWITSSAGTYKFIIEAQDHDNHTTTKAFPLVVH